MEVDFIEYLDYVPYTTDNEKVYSPRLIGMLLQACGYVDSVFKAMAEYTPFKDDSCCREIVRRETRHISSSEYALQEMAPSVDSSESDKTIRNLPAMMLYCEAFEKLYSLSSNNGSMLTAKVGWEEPRDQINRRPFQSLSLLDKTKQDPQWWGKYNAVKHTWHRSIKEANLRNVLDALGAAFLINAVHLPSLRTLYDLGLIQGYIESAGRILKGKTDHIYTLEPDDFQRDFEKAEALAFKLRPVRFAWHYMMETPLFIFKHPKDPIYRTGDIPEDLEL